MRLEKRPGLPHIQAWADDGFADFVGGANESERG